MRQSPRIRRLRTDFRAIQQLQAESTIIEFDTRGDPPETYLVTFHGRGFWLPQGDSEVLIQQRHKLTIGLGAGYPRMMPQLTCETPIFHPNISGGGVICLGGYGTHWVPSVNLDELCNMLWDMVRYRNYDVDSPYNREAADWAKTQFEYSLPIDPRPLRDITAGYASAVDERPDSVCRDERGRRSSAVLFLDDVVVESDVVEAQVIESNSPDILFID